MPLVPGRDTKLDQNSLVYIYVVACNNGLFVNFFNNGCYKTISNSFSLFLDKFQFSNGIY